MNETALRTEDHTTGYGAPEIVNTDTDRETSDYTNAVDVWCVGVTAFRVLAGQLPFPNDQSVKRYDEGKESFPAELLDAQNVSGQAKMFMQWLLSSIPSHRPTVERALEEPWLSGPASPPPRRQPPSESRVEALPLRLWEASVALRTSDTKPAAPVHHFSTPVQSEDEGKTITSSAPAPNVSDERTLSVALQSDSNDTVIPKQVGSSKPATYSAADLARPRKGKARLIHKSTAAVLFPMLMNGFTLWTHKSELALAIDEQTLDSSPEWLDLQEGMKKPLLLWAVATKNSRIVFQQLQTPLIDVNARESIHGWTALTRSVINGDIDTCRLLLRHPGTDPNLGSGHSDWSLTPLMIAAADGHAAIVELLLAHDLIDVNRADTRWGRTALSWAAGQGQRETLRLLMRFRSTNIGLKDREGKSALAWAIDSGNLQVVEELRTHGYLDRDHKGRSALWKAVKTGNTDMVPLLLKSNLGARSDLDDRGRTILIAAAGRGHVALVRTLLSPSLAGNVSPANLRWKDINGQTALIHAAKAGHNDAVESLLTCVSAQERRNLIDEMDDNRRTALSWAAGNGHASVVNTLRQRQSRATALPDNLDQIPLHKAIIAQDGRIANMLIRADPLTADYKDQKGRTPLSLAAERGMLETMQLLLTHGVEVGALDNEQRSPGHWAALMGHRACLAALIQHEHFSFHDADGHTIWTKMVTSRHFEGADFPQHWRFTEVDLVASGITTEAFLPLPGRGSTTAFSQATGRGNIEATRILRRGSWVLPSSSSDPSRPFIDLPDTRGRTPLSWAVEYGNVEFARFLLRSKMVSPSSVDHDGYSSMSYAILHDRQLIATWLSHHKLLDNGDFSLFWEHAPGWAIKDRIISKLFPINTLEVNQLRSRRNEMLNDSRTIGNDGWGRNYNRGYNWARFLIDRLQDD